MRDRLLRRASAAAVWGVGIVGAALCLPWMPGLAARALGPFGRELVASFRQLMAILAATVAMTMPLALPAACLSVARPLAGRATRAVLDAIESVPSMLVALFAYAPFAMAMAVSGSRESSRSSILVFCTAATITALPEAVRRLSLVLADLYNRRYSLAFRSYGMSSREILGTLLASREMLSTLRDAVLNVALRTVILDSSFGFIVQLGFGSYGRPAHTSPGALIASYRACLITGETPEHFWLPSILLAALTFALLAYRGRED
jgi:ABC-type dipeptide/oligopeptide/nickel transport system permease subunit